MADQKAPPGIYIKPKAHRSGLEWTIRIAIALVVIAIAIGVGALIRGKNGATLASGPGTPTTERLSPTASWVKAHQTILGDLAGDMEAIHLNSVVHPDVAALGVDCHNLYLDVRNALKVTAIPSPAVQQNWVTALDYLNGAANSCDIGVAQGSEKFIAEAASQIIDANSYLQKFDAGLH